MGVQDIVTVVEHDFTADSALKVLPPVGTVDIVTMSYSFSMIPDQKAAVKNVHKLLKPGGYYAIADFFLKGNYDDSLPPFSRRLRSAESLFHKNWFAMDHVHLLGEKELDVLSCNDAFEPIWDNRFRGDTPFLPFLKPYHGVYILEKKN